MENIFFLKEESRESSIVSKENTPYSGILELRCHQKVLGEMHAATLSQHHSNYHSEVIRDQTSTDLSSEPWEEPGSWWRTAQWEVLEDGPLVLRIRNMMDTWRATLLRQSVNFSALLKIIYWTCKRNLCVLGKPTNKLPQHTWGSSPFWRTVWYLIFTHAGL